MKVMLTYVTLLSPPIAPPALPCPLSLSATLLNYTYRLFICCYFFTLILDFIFPIHLQKCVRKRVVSYLSAQRSHHGHRVYLMPILLLATFFVNTFCITILRYRIVMDAYACACVCKYSVHCTLYTSGDGCIYVKSKEPQTRYMHIYG